MQDKLLNIFKLSIEEAKKCISTDKAYNVGCIITDNELNILTKGYIYINLQLQQRNRRKYAC